MSLCLRASVPLWAQRGWGLGLTRRRPKQPPLPVGGWDRLARAVAGRVDDCRLGEEGHRYRAAGWPAAEPAGPWAVHLADRRGVFHSLALDLDPGLGDVDASLSAVRFLFGICGVAHVVCRSGPGGGAHVLATFTEGLRPPAARAVCAAISGLAPALDASPMCNPATGAIRPPLAPHRDGGRSQLVAVDEAQAVQLLEDGNGPEALVRLGEELGIPDRTISPARRPLSTRVFGLLRNGEGRAAYPRPNGTGPDVSAMVMAVLLSSLNSGWDPSWAWHQLADQRNWLARQLQARRSTRTPKTFEAWKAQLEHAARAKHRAEPPVAGPAEGRQLVEATAAAVAGAVWTGRTGLTDLSVLHAHLTRARACSNVVHSASLREVAELAGVTHQTAGVAHRRLQAAGWLRLDTNPTAVEATKWRLAIPLHRPSAGGPLDPGPVEHDLFAWRGLGRAAARLYQALSVTPAATVDQLAAHTQLHIGTCRRSLGRLAGAGVAARDSATGAWALVPGHDLDDAVHGMACAGTLVRRRIRHDLDRRAWSSWRDQHPQGGSPGGPAPPYRSAAA